MPRTAFLKVGSLLPALALRAVPQASLLSGLPGDAPFFQPPFFPRASQRAALSRERRDGRDLQRPDVDRRRYERRDRCGGSVAAHRRALRGARAEEAAEGAAEGGRRWRWVAGATVDEMKLQFRSARDDCRHEDRGWYCSSFLRQILRSHAESRKLMLTGVDLWTD